MMRGIPRIAVDKNLPVYGTNYTAKDVADLDHVCKWNPDNYGLNQSHPGAQAWYDAQLDLFASWGLDFLKVDDMQTPFHSDEIAAYHRAIAKAEAKYGRSIDLSLSPGGWVATSYVDFLRENAQMWRISDDLWDRWEDIYQQFARLARWAPFQTTGHWADADMVPFGHIGLRAERGDDRQSRLTLDEQKTLLALWCMGRSPLMVGGDLPTSNSDAIALLQNPALREVLAGSTNNRETVRERIFGKWWDESTYRGEFIVWSADAADWADGTRSAHHGGHYAALFWTGSDTYEIGRNIQLQSIVGLDARNDDWTLADLYADAPGEPADVRLEGLRLGSQGRRGRQPLHQARLAYRLAARPVWRRQRGLRQVRARRVCDEALSRASPHHRQRLLRADRGLELLDLVGLLPRELNVRAAEVTIRGGLQINRTFQIQLVDNRSGAQIEDLAHGGGDLAARHALLGAEGFHVDGHRIGNTNSVGDLDLNLVGQTGAGKTTMVNLLMRFYEISGGTISIDGIDTKSVPRWNVHDQFSMVLQDTWVFRGTVRENIAYSKKDVTDEQIVAACKAVGLHHYIKIGRAHV